MRRTTGRREFRYFDRDGEVHTRYINDRAWRKMGGHERQIWQARDSIAARRIEKESLDAVRRREW